MAQTAHRWLISGYAGLFFCRVAQSIKQSAHGKRPSSTDTQTKLAKMKKRNSPQVFRDRFPASPPLTAAGT
jgi:hypothetical protein